MKSTTAVTLSDDDIKTAIAEWMQKQMPGEPWKIEVGAGLRLEGYGACEYPVNFAIIKATR